MTLSTPMISERRKKVQLIRSSSINEFPKIEKENPIKNGFNVKNKDLRETLEDLDGSYDKDEEHANASIMKNTLCGLDLNDSLDTNNDDEVLSPISCDELVFSLN